MSKQLLSELRFAELPMDERLIRALGECGFEFCTPVQAETLPHSLQGKDVAGQAQTGTGKTAAFMLATMDRLLKTSANSRHPRALVLAPTRELAIQIHKDATEFGKYSGLRLGLAYGGTGYETQRAKLEAGVDILIGTPGRIIDYFKQGVFKLKDIDVVVLDEADRMFDLGFIKDIRYLLRHCPAPADRLGLLFSATLSQRIKELAYDHMNEPVSIKIESEKVTADRVRQLVYYTANSEKIPVLVGLFQKIDAKRSLVFVNTKRTAEKVWGFLKGNGFDAAILSGDVPQKKRQSLLESFSKGELQVMVATDVAARGLHIPDVSHVFNFDLPQDAEDYVHRIGRTARFGSEGDAISFACEDYAYSLPDIESYIGHSIETAAVTDEMLVELQKPVRMERKPRDHRGGPRGRSGGGRAGGGRHHHRGHRSGGGRR